ncbi:transketolase family protein [Candidatus Woesebacteria bacterium]|nr:transketolase family protein [Candidatus Woesebacteria bacterium]
MVGVKTGTTRDGFGKALVELGMQNAQVVVLSADLTESMRAQWFKSEFPDRFLDMGVQEENMVGVAAGLSLEKKIPFACSFSVFIVNNALGPIRASVCYTNANVKLIGGHAGITTGEDGVTHQALEDIATMRALPNMTVIVPADEEESRQATHAIAKHVGPCYLRVGKFPTPHLSSSTAQQSQTSKPFKIGTAKLLHEGSDLTLVACGNMVAIAVAAAQKLCEGSGGEQGICVDVINMHTIKPLDTKTLFASLKKTRALLTIEEHQTTGGLGSAVLEAVATHDPTLLSVPAVLMGIPDTFGQSGTPQELLKHYHLDQKSLEIQIQKVVSLVQANKKKAYEK